METPSRGELDTKMIGQMREFRRQGQVLFFHKLMRKARERCLDGLAFAEPTAKEYLARGQQAIYWRDLATKVLGDDSIQAVG